MLFNSYKFLLFFPIVTAIYFLLPHRLRWVLLLIASCVFYCAFIPSYILILFFTILVDYFAGIMIERSKGRFRKGYLVLSIIANVGILAVFKYYDFFIDNVNVFLNWCHIPVHPFSLLNIVLPIGLSFHTFQAMSYTIEVYRGKQAAERHLGIYSLYVLFYPQLVAGPIERPQNIIHQFKEEHTFSYERAVSGLRLMLWGMFKKVVIADKLAVLVNEVYSNSEHFSGLPLIVATLFFSVQIYCDFSGYSDIAIGSARVMGFTLMKNFNLPYFSTSITEFWRRWHISLSTWFRDYVYIPLGGNRVNWGRRMLNLFIVFGISGLWHGANWTFIVWGVLHGFYLAAEAVMDKLKLTMNVKDWMENQIWKKGFAMIFTFMLTAFAWIFFISPNLKTAKYVITHLFGPSFSVYGDKLYSGWHSLGIFYTVFDAVILGFSLIVLKGVEWLQYNGELQFRMASLPSWRRWGVYYLFLLLIAFSFNAAQKQFIYFQF